MSSMRPMPDTKENIDVSDWGFCGCEELDPAIGKLVNEALVELLCDKDSFSFPAIDLPWIWQHDDEPAATDPLILRLSLPFNTKENGREPLWEVSLAELIDMFIDLNMDRRNGSSGQLLITTEQKTRVITLAEALEAQAKILKDAVA